MERHRRQKQSLALCDNIVAYKVYEIDQVNERFASLHHLSLGILSQLDEAKLKYLEEKENRSI